MESRIAAAKEGKVIVDGVYDPVTEIELEEALQPAKKDWLAALSTEARKQLNAQVQKKTFSSDEDWINRGTEPTKENFAVFKLEKNSVRIVFSQYQVGPYASGMPEIVVPRSLFK